MRSPPAQNETSYLTVPGLILHDRWVDFVLPRPNIKPPGSTHVSEPWCKIPDFSAWLHHFSSCAPSNHHAQTPQAVRTVALRKFKLDQVLFKFSWPSELLSYITKQNVMHHSHVCMPYHVWTFCMDMAPKQSQFFNPQAVQSGVPRAYSWYTIKTTKLDHVCPNNFWKNKTASFGRFCLRVIGNDHGGQHVHINEPFHEVGGFCIWFGASAWNSLTTNPPKPNAFSSAFNFFQWLAPFAYFLLKYPGNLLDSSRQLAETPLANLAVPADLMKRQWKILKVPPHQFQEPHLTFPAVWAVSQGRISVMMTFMLALASFSGSMATWAWARSGKLIQQQRRAELEHLGVTCDPVHGTPGASERTHPLFNYKALKPKQVGAWWCLIALHWSSPWMPGTPGLTAPCSMLRSWDMHLQCWKELTAHKNNHKQPHQNWKWFVMTLQHPTNSLARAYKTSTKAVKKTRVNYHELSGTRRLGRILLHLIALVRKNQISKSLKSSNAQMQPRKARIVRQAIRRYPSRFCIIPNDTVVCLPLVSKIGEAARFLEQCEAESMTNHARICCLASLAHVNHTHRGQKHKKGLTNQNIWRNHCSLPVPFRQVSRWAVQTCHLVPIQSR